MANETILRNGLIAKAASEVEGTLGVQGLQMLNSSNAVQYTFPTTDSTGNSGYALTTNGAGTLAFAAMPDISALLVNISSESIHDLNDVEAASGVATGDVLQWSGSTWAHVAATSIGVTTLEALTDTTITAAADGDFLRHNGSAWVDSAIQNSDITSGMVTQHDGDIEITVSQVTDFDPSDYVTTTAGNTNYVLASAVGANSGVASLDASGLVPSTQLPSYVDDVIEFDQPLTTAGDPVVGDLPSGETETTGKIYVDTATNDVYRWSGSAFVNITDFATPDHNLTTHGDVTIASVGTGELLQYTGSEWENQTLDEVGLSIGNLSDVDITSAAPSNQQVLAWNDTDSEFQPTSVSSLSQSDAVSTLTDVTLSSLATGELLVSTGASSWANKTIAEAGLAAASHTHTASEITDFSAAAIIVADAQIAAADIQDLNNVTNIGTAGQVLQSTGTNATFVTLDHDDITDFDAEVDAIVDTVIAATDIADLSDVTGTASEGDVLVYTSSAWTPTAAALYERTSTAPGTDAATTCITEALVGGYAAITVEYSVSDATNMRMGQVMAITDGSTVEVTDISTAEIGGDTDEPVFSATTDGSNLLIKITDASGYTVKTAHIVVNG